MENNLSHAGIKGMKWGVRRFQNKDGSLTPAGKQRYGESSTGAQKTKSTKKKKKVFTKERMAKVAAKGAGIAAKLALTSAVDDIFYGGIIKDSAKFVGKQAARGIITAWEMGVHGGYDIKWYDN